MSYEIKNVCINDSLVEVTFKRYKKTFKDVAGTVHSVNGLYYCTSINGNKKAVDTKKKVKKFFKKQFEKCLESRYSG